MVWNYGLMIRVKVQGYGLGFTHTYIAGTSWDVPVVPGHIGTSRTVHDSPGHRCTALIDFDVQCNNIQGDATETNS